MTDGGLDYLRRGLKQLPSLTSLTLDFSRSIISQDQLCHFLNSCWKITNIGLNYVGRCLKRLYSLTEASLDFDS